MFSSSIQTLMRVFIFVILFGMMKGQNEAKIWYFGNGLGFDFTTSPPTLLTNGSIATSVGCAVICSPTGGLLFYTDGQTVWNQTHAIMANGTGLFGDPGAQNSVIVKKPQSTNLYYVFTVQGSGGSAGFCYSIVDMALSAGNGSVIAKNVPIFSAPCEEKISATKHCNQNDAWILVHTANTNSFVSVALTATGVGSIVISSPTMYNFPFANSTFTHTGHSPFGSLKFSPNGRRFVEVYTNPVMTSTTATSYSAIVTGTSVLEYGAFDNATGQIMDIAFLVGSTGNGGGYGYGTEFSPDGTKMYYVYWAGLLQFNLCVSPSLGNGTIIEYGDPLPTYLQRRATLQLAPDGKIYVANPGLNTLGIINNPNAASSACMYTPQAVALGTTCSYGLPNFYTPYFEKTGVTFTAFPVAGNNCQTFSFYSPVTCVTQTASNTIYSGYTITTSNWNFGDPASGSANTSTFTSPTHYFSAPGTYTVQLLKSYFCGRTDTIINTIVVPPAPVNTIITPSLSCGTTSAIVTTSLLIGTPSYTWLPTGITGSIAANLPPGTHTVMMLDTGSGCIISNTFTTQFITIGNSVAAPTLCSYVTAGSATANPFSGSGNYTYSWSSSNSTNSIVANLVPGNYSVMVTDVINNCTITTPFQIYQSSPLINTTGKSVNGVLCTGSSCTVNVFATGGTFPYTYTWTNVAAGQSINVTQYTPGTYVYTIVTTDANNCVATTTLSLLYAPTPTLSVPNYTVCSGASLAIVPTGAPFYNLISVGSFTNSIVVNPVSAIVYTIVGQNSFCYSTTTSSVTTMNSPTIQVSGTSTICEGGNVALNAVGAQSYNWSGPLGFVSQSSNVSINSATQNMSGVYFVTGIGANFCSATASLQVIVNPNPVLQLTSNSPICIGQILTLTGSGAMTYTWSGPNVNSNLAQLQIPSANLSYSGIYNLAGKSSASCMSTGSISVSVNSYPLLSITGNTQICVGTSGTLLASGASSYSWSNGSLLPVAIVSAANNTLFTVTGSNGPCTTTAQIKVAVSVCTGIFTNSNNPNIDVYPNPVSDNLFVRCPFTLNYQIFNVSSQIISEDKLQQGLNSIDVSQFPSGVYLLVLIDAEGKNNFYKIIR